MAPASLDDELPQPADANNKRKGAKRAISPRCQKRPRLSIRRALRRRRGALDGILRRHFEEGAMGAVAAKQEKGSSAIVSRNPSTGEVLGEVPEQGADEVRAAV